MVRTDSIAHGYDGQTQLTFKDWKIDSTEQWGFNSPLII